MSVIAEAKIFSCKDSHNCLGLVRFYHQPWGIIIKFDLHNIPPGAHGAHIHTSGKVRSDGSLPNCDELGGHWRTHDNEVHGDINQPNSHLGDLGNITANMFGNVNEVKFAKRILCIRYILNRYIIIHADTDNLGMPGDPESLETGRSGARIAYGKIKIV